MVIRNLLHAGAFVTGLGILGATAHVTISHSGGYDVPEAKLIMGIAIGVAFAALTIGAAISAGRKAVAVWLAAAIVAGEAFGFLTTAERIVTTRDSAQAPLLEAAERHTAARRRVETAQAALDKAPGTSTRLERATATKAAADQAVLLKSAEKGCRRECRALLDKAVDDAAAEVKAARAEVDSLRAKAEAELNAARAALAALKAPASATPLADRVGLPAWVIDLLGAALGSMAANGLACGLLAFSAHGRKGPDVEAMAEAQARLQSELDAARTEIEKLKRALKNARRKAKQANKPANPPPSKVTPIKRSALKVVGGNDA